MFDAHASQLIEMLPALPGLDRVACRRALSAAYLAVVRVKLGMADAPANAGELESVRSLLRRMADALESAGVFDPLNGVELGAQVEAACAFVAAEALALLAQIPPTPAAVEPVELPLQEEADGRLVDAMQEIQSVLAIEAGLLYLIGGYDVNAVALVRDLASFGQRQLQTLRDARLYNAEVLRERLKDFCSGRVGTDLVGQLTTLNGGPEPIYSNLVEEVRTWIYHHLASALTEFLAWLGGEGDDRRVRAREIVEKVRRATAPQARFLSVEFADMHHLASLIGAAFDRTATRSVAHVLPLPPTQDVGFLSQFANYIKRRVRGTAKHHGRPFLWPSAMEYVQECLPGPFRDAVIAMPTGSGKGFVAELAIVHALSGGSVLYLAPTNALVHQIRRDIEYALQPFENVKALAFIGSGEYTGLEEEGFGVAQGRFVAVMTPEKCALALRLNPEVVATCSLCVFDECHLINDEQRGITADVLMAQLFHLAPAMRFVLMSAMVSNPEQLADWLHTARGLDARPSVTKWRPTRTLRGMLVVDRDGLQQPFQVARDALETIRQTQPHRKNQNFAAPLGLAAGLSGPWTIGADEEDYRFAPMGASISAKARWEPRGIVPKLAASWKNPATGILAERLSSMGIPTIGFVLTSRHHPFNFARKVTKEVPGHVPEGTPLPVLIEAWLAIADAELGVQTELRSLLRKGITVHTSAMLQVEQAAAEYMFQEGLAKLMFATGTLAQGLNLPALAVVVGGTTMGDPRDVDKIPGLGSRVDAAILNAFGRAGRPSYSNQGIAILVPDNPVSTTSGHPKPSDVALHASSVLTRPDAGVEIGSPIVHFFDRMLVNGAPLPAATPFELSLTAQLAEQPIDGDHAGEVLRRTFGGYLRRNLFTPQVSIQIRDRLEVVKAEFLQQPGMPAWMNTAATQAGVDIFRASKIWAALEQHGVVARELAEAVGVPGWLTLLFDTIRRLPPKYLTEYSSDNKTPTVLTRLRESSLGHLAVDQIPWPAPANWMEQWNELHGLVSEYMDGASYAALGRAYYGAENIPEPFPTSRTTSPSPYNNPLPGVFGFIREIVDPLARDAGCLVAILEQTWKAEGAAEPPQALQALPLCVRFGCNSLETLAWYRFGFRQRVSAHALAKAFPLPVDAATDSQRAIEVRQLRGRWLAGQIAPAIDNPILQNVATVLREAGD
ncbi:MAG: hypothetical protein QOH39_3379 [Verrucomicrobiota bacterium]|jgi:hypothetical protein